jgi:hypothetical protein
MKDHMLQPNMWTDDGNIKIAQRHMNVDIGTQASQFPERKYINGIFVSVHALHICTRFFVCSPEPQARVVGSTIFKSLEMALSLL